MKNKLAAYNPVPTTSLDEIRKGQAMAEERNLALARVTDSADDDVDQTKAVLQRRMEARANPFHRP